MKSISALEYSADSNIGNEKIALVKIYLNDKLFLFVIR